VTGADLRTTSIQLLTNEGASSQLILLLTTIVKMSEILYSDEEIRTPRRVLQLYNTTWLHLELCRELFPSLQKINQTRFFGTYLHSLTAHSPIQYELMSQKSVNTEHQE